MQFYRNSFLLPDPKRAADLAMLVPSMPDLPDRLRKYARLAPPYAPVASGEGQLGVFEGLTSDISVRDPRALRRSFSALSPLWRWPMAPWLRLVVHSLP